MSIATEPCGWTLWQNIAIHLLRSLTENWTADRLVQEIERDIGQYKSEVNRGLH